MQRADDAKSKAAQMAKMFPSMKGLQAKRRDNTSTSSLSLASLPVTQNSCLCAAGTSEKAHDIMAGRVRSLYISTHLFSAFWRGLSRLPELRCMTPW